MEHTVSRAPAEFSLDGASTHSTSNSPSDCSCFHVPYNTTTVPFPMRPVECKLCHECHVPEMLFGTIEPPSSIPCVGEGVLINAQVARRKLYPTGEKSAQYASDQIPFMTHNLHRQLVYKLKLHGCNVLFGLRIQLDIGDELLVAQATATGFCVPSLPLPRPLEIRSRQRSHSDLSSKPPVHQLDQIKHSLEKMSSDSIARQDKLIRNTHWVTDHPVDLFVLPKPASTSPEHSPSSPPLSRVQDPALETPDLSAELTNVELEELDLNDDVDHDLMAALQDAQLPEGFSLRTVESLPSTQPELARMRNVQMISMVRRVIWERSPHKCDERFSKLFREVVQAIACRVQPMFPCCVTGLRSQVDLSSANEVQITVTGMVLQQMESSAAPTESPTPQRPSGLPEAAVQRVASEDLLGEVASDEDEFIVEVAQESDFSTGCGSRVLADNVVAMLDDDAARVELTPLSFIPGMRTRNQGRLGYVSLVLIKEVVKGASPAAGGLKANCFTTMAEAHSMLRSIVLSRGGNTLLNFRMQECVILQTKQDMYALLHFYGDAAKVEPL